MSLINLNKNMYANNKAMVKIKGKLRTPFSIEKGIRQSNSLSPLLFNMVTVEIIKKINLKKDCVGNKEIKIMCYTDDILIVENENDLQ